MGARTRRFNMKKLFENWNKYLNEAYSSDGKWKSRFPDGRSKGSDVEPETDQARKHRREKEERRRREREALGYPPEKSKYFQENEYEPGRAVADIHTGEERMSPEELMRDQVQVFADKFNVEASVEIASDGKPAIMVRHQSGEVVTYNDAEEMYQDLARRQEMNEELRDYVGGQSHSPDLQIPGYGIMTVEQAERKLARLLEEAAQDAARNPPQYSHLNNGVIQALHQALKEFREI